MRIESNLVPIAKPEERPRNTVLRGISLSIKRREFVTLLSPSGCGKTTTLRIISGTGSRIPAMYSLTASA